MSKSGNNLMRGAVAGLVAGLVASAAMDGFQRAVAALSKSDDDSGQEDDPATVRAANAVAEATLGHDIPEERKPLAGNAVHYLTGAALGIGYGIAAELRPEVTRGGGTLFGLSTASLLDEAAVPALGLGDPPWQADASTHAYSFASHLVFGTVTELTRRAVAKVLRG